MQPELRMVVANGDLILQQKKTEGKWPWNNKKVSWVPYRNMSEEVRFLKDHMDNAFMQYKNMQHMFMVAQKNVQTDIETLQMYKFDNSEVEWEVPTDFSILDERDGIKYSGKGNNNSGKGGGGGNPGGNNNQNNGQGNNQGQQNKAKKPQNKPVSIAELIMNGRIVMPNQQSQAS